MVALNDQELHGFLKDEYLLVTASPISSSRIRTASNTRPSARVPRFRWKRIASMAAWMSDSR